MIDENTKMDNIIKDDDVNKANGILFILFIYLVSFNTLYTALMGFSLSAIHAKYLLAIGQSWIKNYYYLNNIITTVLIIWGFIIGLGINNLKKIFWIQFKFYIVIQQVFFIILILAAYKIISLEEVKPILAEKHISVAAYTFDFYFRLASSSLIFGFWFLYSIFSRKPKKVFA
jgi:hypothetical protein